MIVVDTNFLILLFDPGAMPHLVRGHDRVKCFVDDLSRSRETLAIPTPVLAELAAGPIDRIDEILELVRRQRSIIIQPFDAVIASQTGALIRKSINKSRQHGSPVVSKAMMKYDAIVAATALVLNANSVITDNVADFERHLADTDVKIKKIDELPMPPPTQEDLFS